MFYLIKTNSFPDDSDYIRLLPIALTEHVLPQKSFNVYLNSSAFKSKLGPELWQD